jgi:cell division transport system ATP-binding protein
MKNFIQRGSQRGSNNLKDQFLFHLDDVSVKLGKVKALESVNLTIKPGEILFITGKSGAGKTTLLKLLASDAKVTSGRMVNGTSKAQFVAQIFQDLKLLHNKTCAENLWVAYDSNLYKSKTEFNNDMYELTKILGIQDKLGLKLSDANGGLKQKIALVRALLSKPDVLIADEPTAALDRDSSTRFFDVLNFYNVKRKLTIIWATHNRDLVKQFPGKIIHLENGKLIYSGQACFI